MNEAARNALAALVGRPVKSPKVAKPATAKSAPVVAAKPATLGNPTVAPTFQVYRPETRELPEGATLVSPGSAGANHEAEKMLASVKRIVDMVRGDLDEPLATDVSLATSFEAVEAGSLAALGDRIRRIAALERLAAKHEGDAKGVDFATEVILQRGLLQDLCCRLYRLAGEAEVARETVVAIDCQSFGSAVRTPEGGVAEFEGETWVAPPTSEATARKIRCRWARMHAATAGK